MRLRPDLVLHLLRVAVSLSLCSLGVLLIDSRIVSHRAGEEALEEGLTAHTGHIGPDAGAQADQQWEETHS